MFRMIFLVEQLEQDENTFTWTYEVDRDSILY
jgi:hypothetical protein